MPGGILGQGTTFNLPNFVGDLFAITPEDTPFLSAIGGLTGGVGVFDKRFEWEFYSLRDPDIHRQALEGADAPTGELRVRSNASNVVEIHHESLEMSYTKLAIDARGGYQTYLRGTSAVSNEWQWQVTQILKQIARDVEMTFLQGAFQEPTDNLTPRKTRGLAASIVTNVVDAAGALLTIDMVNDALQLAYENGGLAEGDTRVLLCGPALKRMLTKVFVRDVYQGFYQPQTTPTAWGANLETIESDFGKLTIMVDRFMDPETLIACSMEECAPAILEVPGKGFLFLEPLAKTGAADRSQIYGEIGLKYGNERKHAKITDVESSYKTNRSYKGSGGEFGSGDVVVAGS